MNVSETEEVNRQRRVARMKARAAAISGAGGLARAYCLEKSVERSLEIGYSKHDATADGDSTEDQNGTFEMDRTGVINVITLRVDSKLARYAQRIRCVFSSPYTSCAVAACCAIKRGYWMA